MDFKDKSVLVIGGSSGIGLELCRTLSNAGGKIYHASRNPNSELDELGVTHLDCDITHPQAKEQLASFIPEKIDGLAYCPGTINLKPFHALTRADFQNDLDVNFHGAVTTIQASLKALQKSGSGSIVLFSTVAAQVGMNFHASVAAAKAALHGLALSLAAEYASSGLRVNVIAPSITDTPLASALLGTEKKREMSADRHPLKRIGDANEVARLAAFLLNGQAGWVSGQIIGVDGGMAAARPLR